MFNKVCQTPLILHDPTDTLGAKMAATLYRVILCYTVYCIFDPVLSDHYIVGCTLTLFFNRAKQN